MIPTVEPNAEQPRDRRYRLIEQIVAGTRSGDCVQMHGAIVATLELYSVPDATHLIFRPALASLASAPPRAEHARAAVCAHVSVYADQ
jgi:hypothetical protein